MAGPDKKESEGVATGGDRGSSGEGDNGTGAGSGASAPKEIVEVRY